MLGWVVIEVRVLGIGVMMMKVVMVLIVVMILRVVVMVLGVIEVLVKGGSTVRLGKKTYISVTRPLGTLALTH